MIVDAHHHLWDPARRAYPWLEREALAPIRRPYRLGDLRARTDLAGVQHTVLVQTVPDATETHEFLEVAQQSQGLVRGVVGWVDLTDPNVGMVLGRLRAAPGGQRLVGIRHQAEDEADPAWLLRQDVLRGLHVVAHSGLVFDLLVRPHQLPTAAEAVSRVPEGRFVLDHAGKPPVRGGDTEAWAKGLRQLAAHDHVTCKLSGLVTEADWQAWRTADLRPFANTVLDVFGTQRIMAGSDWPVCELAADYARVWETLAVLVDGLSPAEQDEVRAGVATRAYRLV